MKLTSQPAYVSIGDLNVPGNQITVEAEINRTTPYVGGFLYAGDIVSKHEDPVNINYLLRPSDAEITTADGVYHITPPVCDIELNKTYHVAMVYDGAMLKFYRNGFLLSQTAVTGNLFQNNFQTEIGYYQAQLYNENFIGYINEVRIWNVARTQAQIQANMNSSLPSPSTQPGLLAYYTFSDLLNKQGNATWNGVMNGAASVAQQNSQCPFITDNDCCPPIQCSFTGDSICAGQTGMLNFHPVSTPLNPPYTLTYSDQVNTYSQSNVQDNLPFAVVANPTITTQYPLLKITDAGNCTTNITNESATITIISSRFSVTPDTSICKNAAAQLNVSGGLSYTWSPTAYLSNPNISNPVARPLQTTKFYVTGKDLNNCNVLDSVTVNISTQPVFKGPSDKSVCKGMSVVLEGNNNPKNLYSWSPASSLDNPNSPDPVATPDQNTVYHLKISDPVCSTYDSSFDIQVVVNEIPAVVAQKSNDIDCSNLTSQLSASGAVSYSWLPGKNLSDSLSETPVARLSSTTLFVVQGTGMNGCFGYDSLTVVVSKTGENAFSVPNAFTPNNDGVNDCFGIRNWGNVILLDFSIYNRWGQRVFETKNPSDCWDGTFQGKKQDAGGFVYLIKASSFCENIVRQGTLLLIR